LDGCGEAAGGGARATRLVPRARLARAERVVLRVPRHSARWARLTNLHILNLLHVGGAALDGCGEAAGGGARATRGRSSGACAHVLHAGLLLSLLAQLLELGLGEHPRVVLLLRL